MNPLSLLKKLKIEFPSHQIQDLELETVTALNPESVELDIYGAILTLVKRSEEVLSDPILFSQVCLGLNGIQQDFKEFEMPSAEQIYLLFDFLEKAKLYFPFKMDGATEEVQQFICICLAEEGFYFLKGDLEPLQDTLILLCKELYGNEIPKGDIQLCEERWNKYINTPLEQVPEIDDIDIQVKQNKFIQEYSNNILKS